MELLNVDELFSPKKELFQSCRSSFKKKWRERDRKTLLIQLTWRSFCHFCWCWYLAGTLWKTQEATRSYNMVSDDPLTAFSSRMDKVKEKKVFKEASLNFASVGRGFNQTSTCKSFLSGKKQKMMVPTSKTEEKSLFLLKEPSCSISRFPLGITDQWQQEKSCRWLCFWKTSVWVFTPYASRQLNFAKMCPCSYHLNCW